MLLMVRAVASLGTGLMTAFGQLRTGGSYSYVDIRMSIHRLTTAASAYSEEPLSSVRRNGL